ncbi:hypothetical protein Gorai_024406, partial [Gossypium raimondii]|nr:hypothetical protein [Gossypium raimondii]
FSPTAVSTGFCPIRPVFRVGIRVDTGTEPQIAESGITLACFSFYYASTPYFLPYFGCPLILSTRNLPPAKTRQAFLCRMSVYMACQVGRINLQAGLSISENDVVASSCLTLATCAIQRWSNELSLSGQSSKIGLKSLTFPKKSSTQRHGWKIALALDTGGVPGNGEDSLNSDSSNLGGTRLGRIVSAGGRQLLEKLNSARKNFPMKIFLLLLGFYTANALATILGQTGDWDVLVAGVVVAAIEGIGMLMYRKSPSLKTGRLQSIVVMVNYWKAGVCLGLFVDAFKLGS